MANDKNKVEATISSNRTKVQTKIFVIASVAAILLMILLILLLVVYRKANNNDIYLKVNDDFSTTINIQITPQNSIGNLNITLKFEDDHNQVIEAKAVVLGNVIGYIPYTITYALSDFTISDLTKIKYITYEVTDGRITKHHIRI